jgi:WD40 repeat protein
MASWIAAIWLEFFAHYPQQKSGPGIAKSHRRLHTLAMSSGRFLALCLLGPALCLRIARADDDLEIAELRARAGNMTAAAISADGKRVLTGEDDGLVTLWDANSSGTDGLMDADAHFPQKVFACALSPDGKHGVSCGDDNMIDVWNLSSGKLDQQISTGKSTPLTMACTPDGKFAATGSDDGRIIIWELSSGRKVKVLSWSAPICGITISPDGNLLAAGYSDGKVMLWDTSTWSKKITLPDSDRASVGALAFSPDGKLLATGNQNGGGFVWNTSDGSLRVSFAGYANPQPAPSPPVAPVFPGSTITPDGRAAIVYLCFSRDGSMLLGSVQGNIPRFWQVSDGKLLGTADWFADNRFYVARFGFTFATANITPDRKTIVLLKENHAQVWQCPWKPTPLPQ